MTVNGLIRNGSYGIALHDDTDDNYLYLLVFLILFCSFCIRICFVYKFASLDVLYCTCTIGPTAGMESSFLSVKCMCINSR